MSTYLPKFAPKTINSNWFGDNKTIVEGDAMLKKKENHCLKMFLGVIEKDKDIFYIGKDQKESSSVDVIKTTEEESQESEDDEEMNEFPEAEFTEEQNNEAAEFNTTEGMGTTWNMST